MENLMYVKDYEFDHLGSRLYNTSSARLSRLNTEYMDSKYLANHSAIVYA
jgi:hypothetical protein